MLNTTLRDLIQAVSDLRADIAATYVRKDVLEPELALIRKDVESHSSWLLWAQRAVIGVVLFALLALVVTGNNPAGA